MTKRLLSLLAAAALTAPVGAARAGAGSVHHGRCAFQPFNQDQVTGSSYGGFLAAAVALRSDDVAGNPVTAEVTCSVRIDGTTVADAFATGTGAVVVLRRVAIPWDSTNVAEVCTEVDFADATPTATECVALVRTQIPPQVVYDTADRVLTEVWRVTDPVVCGALAALAPGAGGVTIDEQGDVYLDGELVWDCPPYAGG